MRSSLFPVPFWVLWFVELWERFGYYAISSILALFFINVLGYTEKQSIVTYGAFASFVYGFVYVGGWLGDAIIGAKRIIAIGAVFLIAGYFMLALSIERHYLVFYGLATIIVGNALFKANPCSLISKVFEQGKDRNRLDAAMTLYYMAINIGSFVSITVVPFIAMSCGYWQAFLLATSGLVMSLGSYLTLYKKIKHLSTPAGMEKFSLKKIGLLILTSLVIIIAIRELLKHPYWVFVLSWLVVAVAIGLFLLKCYQYKENERKKMYIALMLVCCGVFFWILYNQMPTTLTFLALHSVDRHFLGIILPAALYQDLNPLVIMIFSPILAKYLYPKWKATHVTKFSMGFLCSGLAFAGMYLMNFFNDGLGHVSNLFLIWNYTLQSIGELLISGLGVAMVAELCPKAISGFAMGIWFLSTMLAGPLSAWVGGFTLVASQASNQIHLIAYANTFGTIGAFTLLFAFGMLCSKRKLDKFIIH